MIPSISLLHATHRAGVAAEAVREAWLRACTYPERVEHIFACDEDDPVSMARPVIADTAVVGKAMPGRITAVRNWNAAAKRSNADILVVIADDLVPPQGWDAALADLIVDLDPRRAAFAINVRDSDDASDGLMRHPVVSRRYYERFGLFEPIYEGIGADNDFTLAAFRRGLVIDGRSVVLDHRHPTRGSQPTESHITMNAAHSTVSGKMLFDERWPKYKRHMLRSYLHPRPGQQTIPWTRVAVRSSASRVGYVAGLLPPSLRAFVRRRLASGRTR